jgi:hypothetical protein
MLNKETQLIHDYITSSGYYLNKIDDLKKRYTNIKDFQLMFSYVIMEILSEEKKFVNLSRKNIELIELTNLYF